MRVKIKRGLSWGSAARLRAKGIDAWVDRWEMLPGDSLVEKIFEDGIKNAQAVIVVLSHNSVNKKWVREELNAAFVKRINSGSRLIPVIIDDCAVPEALQSTLWERITDLGVMTVNLTALSQQYTESRQNQLSENGQLTLKLFSKQ